MPDGFGRFHIDTPLPPAEVQQHAIQKSLQQMYQTPGGRSDFAPFFAELMSPQSLELAKSRQAKFNEAMAGTNAIAKAYRENSRAKKFKTQRELIKDGKLQPDALVKANLDVGTLTNFAQITGGQSLGFVSLDTRMARGTVRPNSFTLYQALHKSAAYQVVDYWSLVYDTGSGLPGTAAQSYSSVSSGTLSTNAGKYELQNVTHKLLVDGRSITVALAAQNSFVDIAGQETTNACLGILSSVDWLCYYGDPTTFPNQFAGIASQIPAQNTYNWYAFNNTYAAAQGWSNAQSLFNLIYEASAQITSYNLFGRITHAFMSPVTAGSLQGLVTTILNNITTTLTPTQERLTGIIVDGDLQGMRTRFGEIQFPIDMFISARNKPAQAITLQDGTNFATLTNPTRPVSVTGAASGSAATGSAWDATFSASSGVYSYAVASLDQSTNESTLTYLLSVSGVTAGGAYSLTITPPGDTTAAAFRVYRSGLGYAPASSGVANPAAYRFIGTTPANGSTPVTFVDLNTTIPGGENIFLLDLDEDDLAVDFRYLLPLSKIDLFASNLFMPWAVAMIGTIRLRIPRFHGLIKNYIADNPQFNPFLPNANAS